MVKWAYIALPRYFAGNFVVNIFCPHEDNVNLSLRAGHTRQLSRKRDHV